MGEMDQVNVDEGHVFVLAIIALPAQTAEVKLWGWSAQMIY